MPPYPGFYREQQPSREQAQRNAVASILYMYPHWGVDRIVQQMNEEPSGPMTAAEVQAAINVLNQHKRK